MEAASYTFYQIRIVVDTNIVFSALVNSNSAIAEIIISSGTQYRFYASEYMLVELMNHHDKIKKASKLSNEEMEIAKYKLFKYLDFITLEIIPEQYWIKAEKLIADIDLDDIAFVALSLYLKAYLWTGDKNLYNGLKSKGFNKVLSTSDLNQLRDI